MLKEISITDAINLNLPIADVRSPGEYNHGHIPGAINIPLFSDDERADLGIKFKNVSPEAAIKKGYFYVEPKLAKLTEDADRLSRNKSLIVHCWRGGMRSRSFAKHLDENGFNNIFIIKGGYKAYRNYVLDTFDASFKINLLGGYTGSGKTFILKELQKIGEQIIDLEDLAHHKGSTFGGIGQAPQHTTEQFENNLQHELRKLDTSKTLWIEDESHNIGKNEIPHNFFIQMQNSKLVFLDIPQTERAKHLVDEYSVCDNKNLADSIIHISKRLGGLNVKNAIMHLENDNYYEVAMIALTYYDKSYLKLMQSRDSKNVLTIESADTNHIKNAKIVLSLSLNLK